MAATSPLGQDWANVTLHLWRNDIRWYADAWVERPERHTFGRNIALASGELGLPMTHASLMAIKSAVDELLMASIGLICDPV